MASLSLTHGDGKPTRLELGEGPVGIGRALDCEIVVMHNMVSRKHAEVRPAASGGWEVVDCGSANKVFVNDKQVEHAPLQHGDLVRLGQEVVLTFHEPEALTRRRAQPEGAGVASGAGSRPGPSLVPGAGALSMVTRAQDLRADFAGPTEHHTVLGLVNDFRKRQEQAQTQTARKESFHFFVLFQLAQAINTAGTIDDLLEQALDLLVESLSASFGAILLVGPEGELETKLTRGEGAGGGDCALQVSRTIAHQVVREQVAMLTRDAVTDPRFCEGASVAALQIHSAVCCPIWDHDAVDGVIYLVASETAIFGEADRDLVTAVGHQIAVAMRQEDLRLRLQEEAAVRSNLMRYHSADVVDLIMKQGGTDIPVSEADVTILFADIEGFTPLSQRLPPAEIARILNGYFEATTEAIFRHRGQVNKYIGDAIMAVFGAPIDNPDHAACACEAALDMIEALEGFSRSLPPEERFRIRIAINSGAVVAGNIGARQRLEYTVIGNTVNVAARLEKCAPPNGVAVGAETAQRVAGRFLTRSLGLVELKGLAHPIEVFVLEGRADEAPYRS